MSLFTLPPVAGLVLTETRAPVFLPAGCGDGGVFGTWVPPLGGPTVLDEGED
ncbi:hypothetical protein BDZ85DRAFT_268373 [Elsinoe ampelina]|uniref:Uncharacterized protein n=1 Tax=Elsinoe ampelina TaxID=302913 RepID=A0A6A6G252_9PEZI|nr:hypothetical protein BDZ85DRAFT_268373 [Elsinoe ampelina]